MKTKEELERDGDILEQLAALYAALKAMYSSLEQLERRVTELEKAVVPTVAQVEILQTGLLAQKGLIEKLIFRVFPPKERPSGTIN